MIQLSNGHHFEFMVASGALAFDGGGWPWEQPLRCMGLLKPELFTVVTKTLTLEPRKGNLRWSRPLGVVKPMRGGVINSIGLTNPGIDWWCEKIGPKVAQLPWDLMVSLEADVASDVITMLNKLKGLPLKGIELNLSCPNTIHEGSRQTDYMIQVCHQAKEQSEWPLIAKLSVDHDYLTMAQEISGAVEAVSINSVPWKLAFPEKSSPLAKFGGGGVSGKLAQQWTWKATEQIASQNTVPVIGPSVWDYEDIERIFGMGAGAVSFGSVFVCHPWRPTRFVERWKREHSGTPPLR